LPRRQTPRKGKAVGREGVSYGLILAQTIERISGDTEGDGAVRRIPGVLLNLRRTVNPNAGVDRPGTSGAGAGEPVLVPAEPYWGPLSAGSGVERKVRSGA
jgi:hypothetical protein